MSPQKASPSSRSRHALLVHASLLLLTLALTPAARAQNAVSLDGSNDYVTFGAAPSLGVSQFTVECWLIRTGAGVATSTGSGGVNAVPLVAKGRAEQDGSVVDMNWFLGVRGTDSVLVADYEEGTGQTTPGLNHPIAGVTSLQRGVWYHAAATFDGTTLRVYLNGALENTVVVGASRLPQSASTQHASIGSAQTSTGAAAGFFAGRIDEARVWSVARSQAQIQSDLVAPLASGTGMVGRWGLDEGAGTNAANSIGGGPAGTLTGGAGWGGGAPFAGNYALQFAGTNAYAAFGNPAALGLSTFTLECWFRRDGAGSGTNTGSGGAVSIPLLAHGRGDQDTGLVHVNWFLGLRETDGVLMADFEESSSGPDPSLNHPVFGVTPVAVGSGWHHAAVTYDGADWRLYLDGNLEAALAVGRPAGTPTVMPASLGSALHADGDPEGFFAGVIDEARVWNVARSQAQIQAAINTPIAGPTAGLVARWGLNEGTGSTIQSSAGTSLPGTMTGSGWSWTGGAPFDLVVTPPSSPNAPTGVTAAALSSTAIRVQWTDASGNETRFEVERSSTGAGGPFTPVQTTGPNVTSWDDSGLSASSNYCYRVRAANLTGNSSYATPACATTTAFDRHALDLSGTTYVTLGDPAALDLAQFTVECWFRRDGAGTSTTTGTGGVTDAIPLVTKGRGESETSNVDLNWFLGLRASDGVLIGDFEEGAAGADPSLNHPVVGTTGIAPGSGWHHAALAYDGSTWTLYLDGSLEATLAVGQPCASASTQPAAIGSALRSDNSAAGNFDGVIDEVRVWSVARTQAQVRGTANAQLDAPTPGLAGRWALDEASGTAVPSSAGTTIPGTINGASFAWVGAAPFDLDFNDPPAAPALVSPANGANNVWVGAPLRVTATDPNGDSLTVRFYGRAASTVGPDFTLIGLPDTQYYTSQMNGGTNAMLKSQLNWIVAQRVARRIGYAVQLGDCVEHGDNGGNPIEWERADTAYTQSIEDPVLTSLEDGIPYGICVGNHDQSPAGDADGSTNFYNQYFGEARFAGRAYYGGHFGTNNDNWYDLFTAGGVEFLSIGLEYDTTPSVAVLDWADALLKAHPNRVGIVSSHNFLGTGNPGTFSTQGSQTYEALKDNPNLKLMLCGHVAGEGRRSDTFNGNTVHTLMSDYQGRTNGGNGWLRLMEFSPANDHVRVRTYSPWLDQWEADADSSSQFTLPVDLPSGGAFVLLGEARIASGGTAEKTWPGLAGGTAYEWYATAGDGAVTTHGATYSFTTGEAIAPTVAVVSPNGGNTLSIGQSATLSWNASDNVGVTSVDLLLSRAGAVGPWETLFAGVANTGSRSWTVTGPPTTDARLKVVARDAVGNPGEDLSDASFTVSSTVGVGDGSVIEFALGAPRPNPARGRALLSFALPVAAPVRMSIVDLAGREVAVLVDRTLEAGRHEVTWNGQGRSARVSSGVYFVRMDVPGRAALIRRLALIH